MADYRAIAAACEAVVASLERRYDSRLLNNELEFKVYTAQDFAQPMTAGLSLFLYRVVPNGAQRLPNRHHGGGRNLLPLDLHFLITAWGKDASLRHAILGWAMRALEDTPTLGAGELNAAWDDAVFDPSEAMEIVLAEMSNEDLSGIWETFIRQAYQLSVPYLARVLQIRTLDPLDGAGRVKQFDPEYSA